MKQDTPVPVDIKLHQKSRLLHIRFSNGEEFRLPCEYLRVFSPATEVVNRESPETGKENVNISQLEPQGSYAIRIVFDDGHDTGIYSWETLYELGRNQQKYWDSYLQKLEAIGYSRENDTEAAQQQMDLNILYFNYLANKLGREQESLSLPRNLAKDVQTLLQTLARRKLERGYLLNPEHVRVTVNRQFAELFTQLENGDEVGIVPNAPTPPAPPKQA